jgi:hypothetical protein
MQQEVAPVAVPAKVLMNDQGMQVCVMWPEYSTLPQPRMWLVYAMQCYHCFTLLGSHTCWGVWCSMELQLAHDVC